MKLSPVEMDFTYPADYSVSLPEAYESLLLDALEGEATQFMRADQIEWAWKVVMPILDAWKKYPKKQLQFYPAGSWGPPAANAILKPFAKEWYHLPDHETPKPNSASQGGASQGGALPDTNGNGVPKAAATPATTTSIPA
jgi:glucose-6-phosphate 1-dehydrogenase